MMGLHQSHSTNVHPEPDSLILCTFVYERAPEKDDITSVCRIFNLTIVGICLWYNLHADHSEFRVLGQRAQGRHNAWFYM